MNKPQNRMGEGRFSIGCSRAQASEPVRATTHLSEKSQKAFESENSGVVRARIISEKGILAFTLAEVLITLVIIGVVSALTVPMLSAQYKKTEVITRLKKFYSSMNAALRKAEAIEGLSVDEMIDNSTRPLETFFPNYILKHISYIDEKRLSPGVKYYLNDGSYFRTTYGVGEGCHPQPTKWRMGIVFDVNGDKGPNRGGRDQFTFYLSSPYKCYNVQQPGYLSGIRTTNNTRDVLIRRCKEGLDNNMGDDPIQDCGVDECTALIMNDGWEFKPDYPGRI